MNGKAFFDTNVLLYLLSQDDAKTSRAAELVQKGGTISVQVLNEMAHTSRRKLGARWPQTDGLLAMVRAKCDVVPLTEETFDQGRYLSERYQLSVYDAMIVSAALSAGATTLYSEDMHDGLLIEGRLKVQNPFAIGRMR
ncbi:MAG TPA: PIN domain-containing protein [Povalibacter sp.]|uniref:PIN domain-containing protein n=1 Tax=Povalibacter sp. TaxID=1962978 RepID=UPI002CA95E2A|nr:PIN domain-containing protein [Povalibacter sp.]HMN43972.1 PIN domain-containing protein [Povalibacter sp.]